MQGRSLETIDPGFPTALGRSRRAFTNKAEIAGRGGGGVLIYCLPQSFDHSHASLSRRSTVPTPINNRDTSNIWALITLLPYFA